MVKVPINEEVHRSHSKFGGDIKQHLLRWKAWCTQGAYSIADLGLTSGANFGINILMARGLSAKEYGAFSVAYAMLLVAMGFQTSYIIEPMSVLGPCHSLDSVKPYRNAVFWLNLMLTLALSGFVAIWAGFAGHGALARTLVSCAISGPFIMGFWFLRRVYYLDSDASAAALSSLIYAIVLTLLAVFLRAAKYLSTESAIVAMGIASLLASIHSYRKYFGNSVWCNQTILRLAREHWQYGKWPVASSFLSLGSSSGQTFLLALSSGLAAAGVLRAMQNLVTPAQQMVSALSIFILPVLSRDIGAGRIVSAHRKATAYLIILVALTLTYTAFIFYFRGTLEGMIYGGKFKQYLWLLPLNGLISVMIAFTAGFSVLLRANQKPQHLLASAAAGSAVGLASAFPFSHLWGIWGATTSTLLATLTAAIVTASFYARHHRENALAEKPNRVNVLSQ